MSSHFDHAWKGQVQYKCNLQRRNHDFFLGDYHIYVITITSAYPQMIVARSFLLLYLTDSRGDVNLVYFNKEKPLLICFAQLNILGLK